MKKCFIALILALVCSTAYAGLPRIAVMALENKAGNNAWDIGTGVADMLTTELVQTKKFRVLERAEINKVMQEQNFGQSGRVTAESAAKLGKILGVEYMIIGSVDEFGTASDGAGAFGVGLKRYTANVGLDIRAIDVATSEIIGAATGKANKSVVGVSISNNDILPTNVNFGSDHFNSSLIGKATREAVQSASKQITKTIGSGNWKGSIIKVNEDGTVLINGGETAEIKVDDIFAVMKKGEEMKDPETGEVITEEPKEIAELKVVEVKAKYSVCKVKSGSGISIGDKIEKK